MTTAQPSTGAVSGTVSEADSAESAGDFIIETHELTKAFKSVVAVDGLTLQIRPGEIFGLLGPDGAGKTTTIRLLSAIMDPSDGWAKVAGFDTVTEPKKKLFPSLNSGHSSKGSTTTEIEWKPSSSTAPTVAAPRTVTLDVGQSTGQMTVVLVTIGQNPAASGILAGVDRIDLTLQP